MTTFYRCISALFLAFFSFTAFSQVEIDKAIDLTGSGASDRQITGLATPEGTDHAVDVSSIQQGTLTYAAETGTANAYVINLSPAPSTPFNPGMVVHFIPSVSNTGSSTLTINGQTFPLSLQGNPLFEGDIVSGSGVSALFDGSNFQILTPSGGGSSSSPSADNGLNVNGSSIQLGGPLIQDTDVNLSGYDLSFSGSGNVGVGTTSPNVAVDIAGALATRPVAMNLSADGEITVGNNSHIVLTTSGSTYTAPWIFTLSNGQPGQYLVLELQSGFAGLYNTGNVRLTGSAGLLVPFSVLHLKWDDINAAWVEISRNGFISPNLLSPPVSYNGKQVFSHTGTTQTFTVPNEIYATHIYVKMWGAGGGRGSGCGSGPNNYSAGGAGAFVSGWVPVTPGQTLQVIVGGAGVTSSGTNPVAGGFGGGGWAGSSFNVSGQNNAGSGGGRSAIQLVSGTDYATAGGGGGAGVSCNPEPYGGGGGAPNGGNAGNYEGGGVVAKGGTTTAGGAGGTGGTANGDAGSQYQGGSGGNTGRGGGGGGGGYYGGGGGPGNNSGSTYIGGGGGGSSFTSNLLAPTSNIGGQSGYSTSPWPGPNSSDPDYIPGIGGTGGHGLVVIYW